MPDMQMKAEEKQYLEIFLNPVRKCREYRPGFGQGKARKGLSPTEFKALYGADSFYSWMGLDTDLMYAAHRAAGGMTSVYRQIGIGCECLFRAILIDAAGYTDPAFATWSYTARTRSKKTRRLSLDVRLELSEIRRQAVRANVEQWIKDCCGELGEVSVPANGVVFEVRQGYKSKDSKRQNADMDNATVAWANGYLPVFAVFSSQIDADIVLRYRNNRCGILVGAIDGDSRTSLYAFCDLVLGYNLADFFGRHTAAIKKEIHGVLETLLSSG